MRKNNGRRLFLFLTSTIGGGIVIKDIRKLLGIIKTLRKQIDIAFDLLSPEQQAYFLFAIKHIDELYKEEE